MAHLSQLLTQHAPKKVVLVIDRLEERLTGRGVAVRRYAKPTNTKVAPAALAQAIASECDVVVEALSD